MGFDRVTPEERAWLLSSLSVAHAMTASLVCQLSPAQWIMRADSRSWSPSEIVEHTLLVDEEILGEVRDHLDDQPTPEWERITSGKDGLLKRFLPNVGRARASIQTSTFRGMEQAEVASALLRTYQAMEEILNRTADAPLKAIVWPHAGMGPLNAYQWLLYIPLHTERHLNQLSRVMRPEA